MKPVRCARTEPPEACGARVASWPIWRPSPATRRGGRRLCDEALGGAVVPMQGALRVDWARGVLDLVEAIEPDGRT
ncbi:hypothetical protein [Microbispora siamensis]|nr:hypothetical protein [Microbispora siamensis]